MENSRHKARSSASTSGERTGIAMVHWLPLEFYPPTINLLRFLNATGRWEIVLFTSVNHLDRPPLSLDGVTIVRSSAPGLVKGWRRALAYAGFQIRALRELFSQRPQVILYVEPQSALPVFLYHLRHRSIPIFIHHHEYHDPHQFLRRGMRLVRFFHWIEKRWLFRSAVWISHTNDDRLRLFHRDNPGLDEATLKILPNLPPASWTGRGCASWSGEDAGFPLRFVYIGSLSLRDTYIAEFIGWLRTKPPGTVEFDIYSFNLDKETATFLETVDSDLVRFHREGVDYDDIPERVGSSHFGLLLYRANTTNYQYNASNKLFEYLACGLDVIYPDKMLGVRPHREEETFPRLIEVDFESLELPELATLASRRGLHPRSPDLCAELVLQPLETALLQEGGLSNRRVRVESNGMKA